MDSDSTPARKNTTKPPISLHVVSRARPRAARNIVVATLIAAFMLLIFLADRDQRSIRECRADLEYAVQRFREEIASGSLPDRFPRPPADRKAAVHYEYLPGVAARSTLERVGVACCAQSHELFLDADGRHVVIYNDGDFEIRWMTEVEFRQQLESLRLPNGGAASD